jgi:DNA-binding MarR family transcriptional regulator
MSSERDERAELLERFAQVGREMSYRTVMFQQAIADRLGLSATEIQCAGVLELEGPMTAGRLAELTGLTTGAITGIVDRLVAAGLVRRSADPSDRRLVIVAWVPEKLAEVARFYEPMSRAIGESLAPLSNDQIAMVVDLVARMNASTGKLTSDLRKEATAQRSGDRESSAPLAGVRSGKLELATGANRVVIVGDASIVGELYRAHFEGRKPSVRVQGGRVTLRHPHFDWRRSSAEIALNTKIPWHLAVHGGAARLRGELRDLALRGIEIDGGVSDVVLELPLPSGKVPVRIAGGASQLTIRRPAGVGVRLEIHGGAARLALDSRRLSAVGGDTVLESAEAEKQGGRYEIVVSGGASDLVVQRG